MRGNRYQISLIFLGIVVTSLFGAFLFRELFPEYRIYQNTYVKLEEFRSSYTGQPSPPFEGGVKQILITRADKGPPILDRCISCHVALQFEHFSPTKVAKDLKGNVQYDANGIPLKVANEEYVWKKLDEKIADLNSQNKKEEADDLKSLKIATVGEHVYDVTKVIRAHPLLAKETRPFEFHNIDDYGCVSCHSGNGSGLVTDRAHGPIFDGQYEEEFLGPEPQFLESDPANDPSFSKIFNHKPSHRLLFQTNPLYLGALIQAKCADCHVLSDVPLKKSPDEMEKSTLKVHEKSKSDFGSLLSHYSQGKDLYISQACYGCHRIGGFARGGVGPELTHAGKTYPWFLKESIVWPQADLKTSTMPNFHLDHPELENLMTFLLAQNGRKKSISEIDYKHNIVEWEAGAKLPWEEPVNPGKLHDVRHSMTLFAAEGCASCHRLEGFDSNVGYSVEKEKIDFKTLYQQRLWFRKLFPEETLGSEIVQTLDAYSEEIDKKISPDIRKGSLLEEIEELHPGLIDTFYSNFSYASRAKNAAFLEPIKLNAWKARVRRVLMMYIQEYGLGRLIGPRPNWSGVYRSDEWLIEHFRQPSRHTPKSIMPVMPFDTSKFYALTYMLDMLAKKNRDSAREIWSHYGFNPEQAYQMYCSQCHGAFLHGNGPVAEWIYPIPKNLRNADFLRNYTKENIINSITHGVKGTPMPPWGEVALDKPMADGIPVLTKNEITQLVDWIFSSLLGSNINVNDENIPKWHYGAGDVIQELKTDVFDVSPNLNLSAEKNAYYIKKRFYTEDNLRAGKDFFDLNCAVCHGNEADGQGYRAGSMYDAKPRMLTNLHWAETRDDLRLLRSIKYGVPGTAMTPWGDLTNSLQRLQLVMYIRSLSLDQQQRDDLFNKLYQIFDAEEQVLDTARISEYQVINQLESQFDQLNNLRQTSLEHAKNGQIDSKQIALLYEQELDLTEKLKHHKEADHLLIELKNLVHEQGKIYQVLGMTLIGQTLMNESFKQYLHLIQVSAQDFKVVAGQLEAQFNDAKETELKGLAKELGASLEVQIQLFEKEKNIIGGKLPSQEKNVELDQIKTHIIGLKKVQQVLAESMTKSAHLRSEQKAIYEKYKKKLKELNYDKL